MNKTSLHTFVTDTIKSYFLSIVIGLPILCGILFLINLGGDYFYVYVWAFLVCVHIFFLVFYPILIQPLFNKVIPLPEGDLRSAIEALAAREKFPLTKIFTMDGSKRSSHSNAYFYGLFNDKRIVLYDTLINQVTQGELLAVVAHELGHWYHSHLMQKLVVLELQSFVQFFLYGWMHSNKELFESFGFNTSQVGTPALMGFMLFMFLYTPVNRFVEILMHIYERNCEYQADRFALDRGYGEPLCGGLIKLSKENLSGASLNPDPLYSLVHFSHPPLLERIEGIRSGVSNKQKREL